jgi:ATP-binding cassette subfamily B multidrug efflux pump
MSARHDASLDEQAEKGLDWGMTKRLLLRARAQWGQLGLAAVLLLLITLGEQAKPLLIRSLLDEHATKGDTGGALVWAGYYMLSIVWVFSLQAWQTIQTKRMGQDLMLDLRGALFRKIHAQPLRFFDKNPVGSLMTRVIYDVETLNQFFTAGVSAVFQDFFTLLVIIFLLLKMDTRLGLVALGVLPFLLWATRLFRHQARENFRAVRANNSAMNAFLTENLGGMATVQLFNREARNEQKFDGINRASLDILLKQIRINAVFLPLTDLLSALTIAVLLWYGGLRYLDGGAITFGTLYATIMYVQRLYEPLRDLTDKFSIFQSAMASSERVFALLDRQEEVLDPREPRPLGPVKGELEFKDLWFAYDAQRWVLKGIDVKIPAGSRVAVVGPTGSGKTSLTNVLFRFYPLQKGQVLLDGQALDQVRRHDFRRHFALVPQDPFLFSGSLLENLRLSDASIPRERVDWALAQVRADAFVRSLPQGLDSELAEGGSNLSTGQKQLLAFARALVFDPAVLVLDEATASVDTATEAEIQAALDVLLKGRTSITIAHRLSTVRDADLILVLRDGALVEQGSHAQLMAAQGLYRGLIELQFKEG